MASIGFCRLFKLVSTALELVLLWEGWKGVPPVIVMIRVNQLMIRSVVPPHIFFNRSLYLRHCAFLCGVVVRKLWRTRENYVAPSACSLNRRQEEIAKEAIRHLIRMTPLTSEEIAEHFGLNIKVVVQLLRDMQESGEIVQESVWIGGRNFQQICLGEKG